MVNPLEGLRFKVTTIDIDDRRFGKVPEKMLTYVHHEEIVDERPGELLLRALQDSCNVTKGEETWLPLREIAFTLSKRSHLRYKPVAASLKDVLSRCLAQWRAPGGSTKTLLSESVVLRRRANILADWFLNGRHQRDEVYGKIERALRSSALLTFLVVFFVPLG